MPSHKLSGPTLRLYGVVRKVCVLAAVLSIVPSASASALWLSKPEARTSAKHFVRERSLRKWWTPTWRWVEPAWKCSRYTDVKVQCHYQFGNRDVNSRGNHRGCFGEVRITETYEYYYARWYGEHCGFVLYD